eukprot:5606639-Alexandrium_andersonii.AAC.1
MQLRDVQEPRDLPLQAVGGGTVRRKHAIHATTHTQLDGTTPAAPLTTAPPKVYVDLVVP